MEIETIEKFCPKAPAEIILDCIDIFEIEHEEFFLAQLAHESCDFRHYRENLNYSASALARTWKRRFANADGTPNEKALTIARNQHLIANEVYNGRMGNRVGTDDGWNYRGRGAIQTTGKTNYIKIGKVLYDFELVDSPDYLLENPDIVATLPFAILTAGAFWKLNNLDDVDDFKTLTKRINGGLNGYNDRVEKLERIRQLVAEE